MREIWFKARRISDGEWVEGFYVMFSTSIAHPYSHTNGEHNIITVPHNIRYKVDAETVCQYTGLTDKTGKKIWEGDIVKTAGGHLVVQWNEKYAGWCLSKEGWMYDHFFGEGGVTPQDCKVIGNIFDNPELLKI